jgi:hypothetical protein
MAGAVGGGDDGEASGLCFFIFSVTIGWPEQQMAAMGRLLPFFYFFVMFVVRQFRRTADAR